MDVQLPDGTVVQGVPEGTTKQQLAQKLQAKGLQVPPQWLKPSPTQAMGPGGDPLSRGLGEAAVHTVTGMGAAALGGLGGIARGAGAGIASLAEGEGAGRALDVFSEEASKTIGNVGEALTYQPRGKVGQVVTAGLEYPFKKLAQGGDWAGQHTANATEKVLRAAGLDPETARRAAAAAGAAVNTTVQSAPAIVGARGRRAGAAPPDITIQETPPRPPMAEVGGEGRPSTVPRGTSVAAEPPQAPPGMGTVPSPPRTAPSDVGAPQAPSAPSGPPQPPAGMMAQPTGPRTQPSEIGAGSPPATSTPQARAQAYAGRIGLDWSRLGAGTRKALETIAQDATALERLDPAAVRRQAALQRLRIPVSATRGQLARDTVQLRREAIASHTTEGQPIRDIDLAANRDVQANLEVLRGRLAGRRGDYREPVTAEGEEVPGALRGSTKTQSEVGESAQGALRAKAKWSKKGYESLYKIAEKTDPDSTAGLKPVTDLLTENPDIQHIGWVQSWLSKARGAKAAKEGVQPGEVDLSQVTLKELYDLRKLATKNMAKGSTTAHYASQVREAVDTAMRDVPEGAAAWKRATDAFRRHQEEFKDQSVIRQLTGSKKGTSDRGLALEKTWTKLATGPLEQLRQVRTSLLKGDNPQVRVQGANAWRDLRAETVNRILEDARHVTAADEAEREILTEAALRRSVKRIPRENLELLLGKGATAELMRIVRARRITTRSPVGGRTTQSGTVPNALVLAERVLKHIPGAKYAVGAKKVVQELGERGAAARAVQEAPISPLEQAARDVERARVARERRAYQHIEATGPTLSGATPQPAPQASPAAPTIGDVLKRPPQ